jgi:formylglycine-generating enzyme required for sulfatase activity
MDWIGYNNNFVFAAPVGRFAPNALGLYDMTGNVWEWVQDVYDQDAYRRSGSDDPIYGGSGDQRVFRGGGWYVIRRDARCSYRFRGGPAGRSSSLGFRLARMP